MTVTAAAYFYPRPSLSSIQKLKLIIFIDKLDFGATTFRQLAIFQPSWKITNMRFLTKLSLARPPIKAPNLLPNPNLTQTPKLTQPPKLTLT